MGAAADAIDIAAFGFAIAADVACRAKKPANPPPLELSPLEGALSLPLVPLDSLSIELGFASFLTSAPKR